jgi:hypothetical protein
MNKVSCSSARYPPTLADYRIVIAADPENDDAKRGLAEVYEILGETRKALNLVNQCGESRIFRRFSLLTL